MLGLNVDLNADRQPLQNVSTLSSYTFQILPTFLQSSSATSDVVRSKTVVPYVPIVPIVPTYFTSYFSPRETPILSVASVSVLVRRQAGQTEDALAIATFIDVGRVVPFYLPVRGRGRVRRVQAARSSARVACGLCI